MGLYVLDIFVFLNILSHACFTMYSIDFIRRNRLCSCACCPGNIELKTTYSAIVSLVTFLFCCFPVLLGKAIAFVSSDTGPEGYYLDKTIINVLRFFQIFVWFLSEVWNSINRSKYDKVAALDLLAADYTMKQCLKYRGGLLS